MVKSAVRYGMVLALPGDDRRLLQMLIGWA
jgi:hypothetical protein